MSEYRYILEPYKGMNTRYDCPDCGKRKTFSRYLDTETGEHLNPTVGRCNRESNCGYHYTPKQYFGDNNISFNTSQPNQYAKSKPTRTPELKPISFIPVEVFKQSLKSYQGNNFVTFLTDRFGIEVTSQLISRYFIATSKHWYGSTVFWQIDVSGKLRTGKIMLYNSDTGKRIKEPFNRIGWVHNVLKLPEYSLQQCFFGEHLLKGNTQPVAIVESEKTAVIASVCLPAFVWIAVGSLTNLSAGKCKVLQGRSVTLFPDLNGFEKWNEKKKEFVRLFPGTRFNISDLLERKATEAERQQGLDLADYLIRFDYRAFQQKEQPEQQQKALERPQPKEMAQVQDLQAVEVKNIGTSEKAFFSSQHIGKNPRNPKVGI